MPARAIKSGAIAKVNDLKAKYPDILHGIYVEKEKTHIIIHQAKHSIQLCRLTGRWTTIQIPITSTRLLRASG